MAKLRQSRVCGATPQNRRGRKISLRARVSARVDFWVRCFFDKIFGFGPRRREKWTLRASDQSQISPRE